MKEEIGKIENLKDFQEKAENLLSSLEYLVNETMIDDGNSEEDSQRLCIMNAIGKVQQCINGTEQSDIN